MQELILSSFIFSLFDKTLTNFPSLWIAISNKLPLRFEEKKQRERERDQGDKLLLERQARPLSQGFSSCSEVTAAQVLDLVGGFVCGFCLGVFVQQGKEVLS